jgi:2-oxoglutarate ferredoxin oxidoreductase subunit alpha
MMEKRMRKMAGLARDAPAPRLEGPADAPLTFLAWGSTVGAVRDAMAELARRNVSTNLVWFPAVYPVVPERIAATIGRARKTLLVEANFSGQFGRLLRAETGFVPNHHLFKYDGEPFYPHEIVAKVLEVSSGGRQ